MSFLASDSVGPFFRFVMELTTWIWLVITIFQSLTAVAQYTAIGLLLFSVGSLSLLNYPGDKRPVEEGVIGMAIPGKVRVLLEIFTGLLGLFFSLILLGLLGVVLQFVIFFMYLRFDTERISWLWGWQTYPPEYVTKMHQMRDQHQEAAPKKRGKARRR